MASFMIFTLSFRNILDTTTYNYTTRHLTWRREENHGNPPTWRLVVLSIF
jgi:hypothetical protein